MHQDIFRLPSSRLVAFIAGAIIATQSCFAGGLVTTNTEAALSVAMADGGTVTFAFDGIITLTGTKTVSTNTILDASGRSIIFNGGNAVSLLSVSSNASLTLVNITLANGKTISNGAAIYNRGNLTALNCQFTNNQAIGTNGANGVNGTFASSGTAPSGKPGMDGNAVRGGAVYNNGWASFTGCEFRFNLAQGGNGGRGGDGGDANNTPGAGAAGGDGGLAAGGAIYSTNTIFITNCYFFGNAAAGGNAGRGGDGGTSPALNYSNGQGGIGGLGAGGGLYCARQSIVFGSTFARGLATGGNSGDCGTNWFDRRITGGQNYTQNGAKGGEGIGGGIRNFGTESIINCTFDENVVVGGNGGDGSGGQISWNVITLAWEGSAGVGGDGGDGTGGGLYSSTTEGVTNCTFYACSAYGGSPGIWGPPIGYPYQGAVGASHGGNVARMGGTFTLKNSIFAYGTNGNNAYVNGGSWVDAGQNISSDNSIALNTAISRKSTDPKLHGLAFNGGITPTCSLQTNSLAIDGATNGAPALDQRGYFRLHAPDIGAYEYNGSSFNYAIFEITTGTTEINEARTNSQAVSITRKGKINETNIVSLDISGTAVPGVDYTALPTNVVFAPDVAQMDLAVTALRNASVESAETVVIGLKAGTNYLLGLKTNAVVTIAQDGPNGRAGYPLAERYLRGTGTNLDFYTIIVPLDGLKGTQRLNMDSNSPLPILYHYNGAVGGSQATTNNRIACNTPVASFGTSWGTPLRPGQFYSVGVHVASVPYGEVFITVFSRSNFAYVDTVSVELPDFTSWIDFATNGFSRTTSAYGLTTIVRTAGDLSLGTSDVGFVFTHTTDPSATNFYYVVSAGGDFSTEEVWLTDSSVGMLGPIYDLVFDERPGWQSLFVEQPQFNGQPLPPDLLNKTPEELLNYGCVVSNSVSISPSTCTNLDQSLELRRHPILDQFVSDMNGDPIVLANYVQNEIELTDAIAYRDDGQVQSESVNPGGVNRGALGVYLEGQGSPVEQCALLIYLLRQAGYPATYVFPPDGGLKMLDTRLSQLLRVQFKGAHDDSGRLYTTNRLISVNYPWVATRVNGQWVHLFPWLKDTQVSEGLNLSDYLPTPYKETQLLVKDYVFGRTNLMSFATATDDTFGTIFPRWFDAQLKQNAPGISVDDFGMRYVNRRHVYAQWTDFPRPTWVTNTSAEVESLTASSITNISPRLTNVFDTVYVEVLSLANPSKIITTPEMRMADLHNRKFFLTHTNLGNGQTLASLILGQFSPNATNVIGTFSLSDTAFTNKQVVSMTLDGTDDELRLRLRHRRQRALTWQMAVDTSDNFLELNSVREVLQERRLRKGDAAAICMNVGRVSPAMLRVHAQELWNMEQMLNTNSVATNQVSVDVYQGSLLYLMGMSYYERVSRFDELNLRLTKYRQISSYAIGLAKLSPRRNLDGTLPDGPIDPVWPNVDMFFRNITMVGNGAVRLDSGWDADLASKNYVAMSIADGSSQEHAILNTFFGQSAAVSTVKVLQLAQSKVANGGSNIVELNYFNYQSAGDTLYGGKTLRSHDPEMWAAIESYFGFGIRGLFTVAWVSPGIQTTPSGSYSGMAALCLGPIDQAALIGNNQYGGYGQPLNSGAISAGQLLNSGLSVDANNNYTWNTTAPTATQPKASSESSRLAQIVEEGTWLNNGWAYANPYQNLAAQLASLTLNGTYGNYVDTYSLVNDVGVLQTDFKEGNSAWSKIADPVNALSGEFYVDAVDLSLPGPMPLQVRRNYGSQNLASSQMGYGWKLNYMPYLSVAQSNNVIYAAEPSGSVLAFGVIGTNLWAPALALNPMLNNNTDQGIGSVANYLNARLALALVNGTNYYYLTNGDGSLRVFQEMSFALGGSLDRLRPYLTSWSDNRGNSYRFEYGTNPVQADYGQVRRIVGSSGNIVRFLYDPYARVVEAFSLDGRRVQYDYDAHGDLRTVTLPDASEINYDYDVRAWATNGSTNVYSTHLLVKEAKPDGRVLQNDYDDQRRVTNQWATVGSDLRLVRNATFCYTNNFSLTNLTGTISGTTTILDYTNNPTTYCYTNGLIRRIIDPLGGAVVQDWYEANETNAPAYPRSLKAVTDKRNLVTTYLYDARGNVTNTAIRGDLLGDGNVATTATTSVGYDQNNLPTWTVDAGGATTRFFYTNKWLLVRTEYWPLNAVAAQVITNVYAYVTMTNPADGTVSYGLRSQEIRAAYSPDAATNEWAYSSRGFATRIVRYTGTADPAVVVTNFYNTRGELAVQTDAIGHRTTLGYDPRGSIQSREVFDNGQSIPMSWDYYYYNENGELTWSDGPRFNPEDYIWRDYDGAGRKSQEIRWRSQARVDGTGVEVATGDDLYATTFYFYDPFNNLTKVTDPLGNYSLKRYDANGQMLREENYDSTGVLLSTNGFAYNLAGDITNAFNALGGAVQKQFTSTGKPKFQKNPDGSVRSWLYYADGRIDREFQNNGAYWQTIFDDANRTSTRIFHAPDGTPLATNVTIFDRRGNAVQTIDAGGNAFTKVFDGLDRLKAMAGPAIQSVVPDCGMIPGCNVYVTNILQHAVTNYYSAIGLLTTNVNALGEKTITLFDGLGRETRREIRSATGLLVRETGTAYSPDHHSVTVTNGAGATAIVGTTFTDNGGHDVLSIAYPSAGVLDFTLKTYDRAENLIHQERSSSSNGVYSASTASEFAYDGLNRLASQSDRDGANTSYQFSPAGNLTHRVMPGGLEWSAIYNNAGQMLAEWNTGVSGHGTSSNTYAYYPPGHPFVGLLATNIDGRSIVCTHYYDNWLRAATNEYKAPVGFPWAEVWQYDARGLATNISEGSFSTIERSYDSYGQLITENSASQSWDAAGRRTGLNFDGFAYGFSWRADGLLSAVTVPGGSAVYLYDTAGILTNRSIGNLSVTTGSRDGLGRALSKNTTVGISSVLSESLVYSADGLLSAHTLSRSDFTDNRSYDYATLTRRLTAERLNVDASGRWTNSFVYDNGISAGPGALTTAGTPAANANWTGGTDEFSRIASETNTAILRLANGRVNGEATVSAQLDGQPVSVRVEPGLSTTWSKRWYSQLELTPGTHRLNVSAAHPSGLFTTNSSVWFTNNVGSESVVDTYDNAGLLFSRTWKKGNGQQSHQQTFAWDEKGRLANVFDMDSNQNGSYWVAIYDALDRRILTSVTAFTNGVWLYASPATNTYHYDPLVEFQELGITHNRQTVWKVYGPDLNGSYGGLNGLGGLAGIVAGLNQLTPVISDARGNVLGAVTNGSVAWNSARPTGYGAVPNHRPIPYAFGADMIQASAWRGHYSDITGLVWLGARYYDPISGRFMSRDPAWNERDPNYYTFCGGDPINYFDADGRFGKKAVNFGAASIFGDPNAAFEGTSFEKDYLNYSLRNQDEQLAEAQWYNGLPSNQKFAYNVPIPGLFNFVQFHDALQSGDYAAAGDSAGRFGVEALFSAATLGFAKLQPETFQPTTYSKTFSIGDLMPNGQVAGVGPGSMSTFELYPGKAGSFGQLDAAAVVGDQLTPHHMPQAALNFTTRNEGGAIMLPFEEHIQTRTYGFGGAQLVRDEAGETFRTILARDIRDLRGIAGSRYNSGIQDLLDYYRQNFPELIAKPEASIPTTSGTH